MKMQNQSLRRYSWPVAGLALLMASAIFAAPPTTDSLKKRDIVVMGGHDMGPGMQMMGPGMMHDQAIMMPRDFMMGSENGLRMMMKMLDLDEQQRLKVWKIYDDSRPAARKLQEESRETREQLRTALENDDQKAIAKLAKKQGELLSESIIQKADMKRQMKAVLTDQQIEKMNAMKSRAKMMMKHHREMFMDSDDMMDDDLEKMDE